MPRGFKRTVPLYISCKREGCEGIRQVRCPADQARGGYCSQRCNALDHQNIRRAGLKGVHVSATQRRRALLQKVEGMTPLEAFRTGYKAGLRSKVWQLRRRYSFVRKQEIA